MKAISDLLGSGGAAETETARSRVVEPDYRRLRRSVVLATAAVALVPLVVMTVVNYFQYAHSYRDAFLQPVAWLTLNTERSLELFLGERRSALAFIVNDRSFDELCDDEQLGQVVANLNRSLPADAFVDLGLIGDDGVQLCYAGPYGLRGRNYFEQDWFQKASRRRVYISDVFLGFRKTPHFALATRHERGASGFYILRATIDAEMLREQILPAGLEPSDDAFLVNREGVLQTPSRRYGGSLERVPLRIPPYSPGVQVVEQDEERGERVVVACAFVDDSPFILMLVKPVRSVMGMWVSLRSELLGFLGVSVALILGVVLWGSKQVVEGMREADRRRASLLHQVEYTNKLASIGRLAAGVAHEINNPLAIINEKAGLLKDLVTLDQQMPQRERFLGLLGSVLSSVERCSAITHRLLGFAKHMSVGSETIDLHSLLREVLGFIGKEGDYRNITIGLSAADDLVTIESDRGQLQQVFLNLLSNALAAVGNGGRVDISIVRESPQSVAVVVADNGCGIAEENLKRIFEPFFTTKEGWGTGLGLSITYGIVEKLGGRILVESQVGVGTRFTVVLPVTRKA